MNLDEATDPWGVKVICIFSKENPTLILIARNFETIKNLTKVHNSTRDGLSLIPRSGIFKDLISANESSIYY